jgi:hypothetical protein
MLLGENEEGGSVARGVVWYFPAVHPEDQGAFDYQMKVSDTGAFNFEACFVKDITMKRPVADEETVEKAATRLTRKKHWAEALPTDVATPIRRASGFWWVALPSDYLDALREDTHSFRIRVGNSTIDIKPMLTAHEELAALGEEEEAKLWEFVEVDIEETHEMCIVGDETHILSRLSDWQRIEELLSREASVCVWRGSIFTEDELESEGVA